MGGLKPSQASGGFVLCRVLEPVDLAQALEAEHPAARHREGAETAQQRRRHRTEPGGAGAGAEFAELVEEPMNSMFTALTRPRMASGVLNWISEERMYMLTMSAPPATSNAAKDSQNRLDRANTRLARPKIATAMNMTMPTWRLNGRVLR